MRRFLAPCARLATLAFLFASVHLPPARAFQAVIRQGQEAPEVANENDFLGWALATGDFNGDGFDDVAMGAPSENESLTPGVEHGAVIVNYGSARGITHLSAEFLTVGDLTDGLVHYGIALAAGNFNNDPYDDLAVGAPDFDGNMGATTSSGVVWIHLGGPTGLPETASIVLDQTWAGDPLEALDRFGAALATGYFDDDLYADLAVGSPGENGDAGAVFVFYGQAAGGGISPAGVQSFDHTDFGASGLLLGKFGAALDAGNLFGGVEEELAIGAPETPVDAMAQTGRVYLLPATAAGLTTAGAFYQDPVLFGFQWPAGGKFGAAITIGRYYDTGGPEERMVVGAPESAVCNGCAASGLLYFVKDFTAPFAGDASYVDQTDLGFLGEDEAGDRLGHALASGDWDGDGFDDLAAGIPGENISNESITGLSASDAGRVALWIGGDLVFSASDANVFHAVTMNDSLESGDSVGWALAFGHFDDSGRANLAIGAPLKDYRNFLSGEMTGEAGQVHILAPWRQPQGLPHRSSAVTDCSGRFVYAQRPFQGIPPASVTKAMTVLLAAEAIQAGVVDTNEVYTVPEWVADEVSGSNAGLVTGQQITFGDLVKLAVAVSAGDACYAIGDHLTGGNHVWNGLDGTLPGFNTMMNLRADQLGMDYSNFNNPSGRPLVDHYMGAYDWVRFAEQAMENPLFRYYVGTNNWLNIPGYSPQPYNWLTNSQGAHPAVDGIKPGRNPLAHHTGLWSARDQVLGRYQAAAFGTPDGGYGVSNDVNEITLGDALLDLAFVECAPGFQSPPPGSDPRPEPWGAFPGIPTGPDTDPTHCFLMPLDGFTGEDALIEVLPMNVVNGAADFEICVWRSSELILEPGETATITVNPVRSHLGFRIYNVLRTAADLQITVSDPASSMPVNIPGEGEYLIPAAGPLASPFSLTIQNLSSIAGVRLQLDENGYKYLGAVTSRTITMTLGRDPHQSEQVVKVCIDGLDPTAENLVSLAVRPGSVPVAGVEPAPVVASAPGLRLRAAAPNPFHGTTTLAYELTSGGPVTITVHDIGGRRVRRLATSEWQAAGWHEAIWDGRDDAGRLAPVGIYFQVVAAGDARAAARVVRVE
jgi:hypothetical protein